MTGWRVAVEDPKPGRRLRHLALLVLILLVAAAVGPVVPSEVQAAGAIQVAAASAKADIELAIDSTGSMGGAIEQAKADASDIVKRIRAAVPDTAFSVVQFRDSGDGLFEYQVVQSMTTKPSPIVSALQALDANGGGDGPEAHNLVFHNSYAASPIQPSSKTRTAAPHVAKGQGGSDIQPRPSSVFGPRTAAEVAGDIGWRSGSKRVVVMLTDNQPHGDLASQGFDGCDDVSADPHGLVTGDELDAMSTKGRTLFMVDYSGYLRTCFQSLTAVTGGKAIESGGSVADDIVALVLTTNKPSALRSSLVRVSGQPKLVPADGDAKAIVKLTLKDAAGAPLSLRSFKVRFKKPAGFSKTPAKYAYRDAVASGSLLTDGGGVARFKVSGTTPGPIQMTIVDDLTGAALGFPLRLELTRKVVVLAQGMGSASDTRSKAWGTQGTSGTVFGWLKAHGYKISGYPADAGDAGAEVLDASWSDARCTPGGAKQCVATIRVKNGDVWWKPQPYSLELVPWGIKNAFREHGIDDWAARLNRTLVTYDKQLAKTRGVHASFVVIGHSMGGQLAVRLLKAALGDKYQVSRPGLLRTVVSIDGPVNWIKDLKQMLRPNPDKSCKYPVQTVFGLGVANTNTAHVQLAHDTLGTQTVMITNARDTMVPEVVARLPGKLFSPGYQALVYRGYGDTARRDCAHSVLLKRQGTPVKALVGGKFVHYPLVTEVLSDKQLVGPHPGR